MKLKYEFKTRLLGEDLERGEEYWDTETYEYEPDAEDLKKVATLMVMEDAECDRTMADKFVVGVLWNYDLLDAYLEYDIDYVKDYFKERAEEKFWESRED